MLCGIVSVVARLCLPPVGTVRNALLTGTVGRATTSRPLPSPSVNTRGNSTGEAARTPTQSTAPSALPPSMSGRALPSLPSAATIPAALSTAQSGTIGRAVTQQQFETMRHAPEPQPDGDDDDQMLEGVIIPALNSVSLGSLEHTCLPAACREDTK